MMRSLQHRTLHFQRLAPNLQGHESSEVGRLIHVDLPPTCVGKDHRSLLGMSFTSGGTGIQLESPVLGVRLGLTEGIELHVLALTLGVDFWPPALLVPFGEGRLGFDDW
jgi:hypothetical protein